MFIETGISLFILPGDSLLLQQDFSLTVFMCFAVITWAAAILSDRMNFHDWPFLWSSGNFWKDSRRLEHREELRVSGNKRSSCEFS